MYSLEPQHLVAFSRAMCRFVFLTSGFFAFVVTVQVFTGQVEAPSIGAGISVFYAFLFAALFRPEGERRDLARSLWYTLTNKSTRPTTIRLVFIPSAALSMVGAFTINPSESNDDFASLNFPFRMLISFVAFASAGLLARFTYLMFRSIPGLLEGQSFRHSNVSANPELQLALEEMRRERDVLAANFQRTSAQLADQSTLAREANLKLQERDKKIAELEKMASSNSTWGHYTALDIGEIERTNAILSQQLDLLKAKNRLDQRSAIPKAGGNLCRVLAKFETAFGSDVKALKAPDFKPYEEVQSDFLVLVKNIVGFNESLEKVSGPVRQQIYRGYVSKVLAPAIESFRGFTGDLVREYHSDTSRLRIDEADRTAVIMILSDIRRTLRSAKGD